MIRKITLLVGLVVLLVPGLALADGPISLGLFTPVQIVAEDQSVDAFRFSLIYGKNVNTTGLDLGLVTQNTGSVQGIQWTGLGMVDGDFTGWQSGWLASISNGNMQGLQTGIYTHAGVGSSGLQWGVVNTADSFSGLQLGVVNIAESMRSGLQIGLINVIKNKEKLKLFPIVNWKF